MRGAPVGCGASSLRQPGLLQAVDQAHHAVMAQQETLGQMADSRRFRFHGFDGEHQLMLLRLYARALGGFLGEMEEAADLMAELGQGSNLALRNILHLSYIVARYVKAR